MFSLLLCAALALPPQDDCTPTPNSTGVPGTLLQTGIDTFVVTAVPDMSFVGLVGGPVAVDWPFGDGRLCINPALDWWRLPGAQLAQGGSVGFNAGAFLAPGQTMHVQSWYRDNNSNGFGFNTTNRVTWDLEQ